MRYKCPTCGKVYNPEKDEICPRCGDAAAPSVLTRIERKRTAQRLRAEGKFDYDEHCHEDDAWRQSYGSSTHRTAVQSHEASLRAGYASHKPVDNPNQRPRSAASRPIEYPTQRPTTVPPAQPASRSAKSARETGRKKQNGSALGWIALLWILYVLYRLFAGIFD